MKKIGYILAAVYAVFSLSVTSLAAGLVEDAVDGAETLAEDVGDGLEGLADGLTGDDGNPADSSDGGEDGDPANSSDTSADDPADTSDTPAESSDTSADITTTPPTSVDNAGTKNPSTGVGTVLGFTALGMAAAGLTAAAARKRK